MFRLTRRTGARLSALLLAALAALACGRKESHKVVETAGGAIAPPVEAAPEALRVVDVTLGPAATPDKRVLVSATVFRPNDTIHASVHTTGAAPTATLVARWTFDNGKPVAERTETIAPTGEAYTEFHISRSKGMPAGTYTLHILLNGQEVSAKQFTVRE